MAPKTFKNNVNQLTWNVPITNPNGTPTDEFQRKWLQQAATNASIVDLTTANAVSAVLDLISALPGALLKRGAFTWGGLASPNDATKFLNGAASPAYAAVKDSDLSLSDVVTNNASTARHGFVPKLPNDATKFYDGLGNFSTPSSGTSAASIYDDGTNIYLAVVDSDEQLVLDGSGLGVYVPEVFPVSAIQGMTGRTNGVAVPAGQVGERLLSEILLAAAVTLTTSVPNTITSLVLPPGNWDVRGMGINLPGAGCNQTVLCFSISTNPAANPATAVGYQGALYYNALPGTDLTMAGSLSGFQINVTVNTTVYLRVISNFTIASQKAYGFLDAVRLP